MSEANRRQIQEALRRLDYYKGPVDGIFGPLTRAAIRRFQHGIGADATGHPTGRRGQPLSHQPVTGSALLDASGGLPRRKLAASRCSGPGRSTGGCQTPI